MKELCMKFLYCMILCIVVSSYSYSNEFGFNKINNLPGASVSAVTQLPNGDVIIGTPYGLWRTNDTFSSWTKIATKSFADSSITRLGCTTSGAVLAGTRNGLYISTDNGNTWSEKSTAFTNKEIKYMYCHNNGTVLVGVFRNLYRSFDNGMTWAVFADTVFKPPFGNYPSDIGAGIITHNGTYLLRQFKSDNGISFDYMGLSLSNTTNYTVDTATNIVCAWNDIYSTFGNEVFAITPDNGNRWIYKSRSRPYNLYTLPIFNDDPRFTQISSVLPLGDNVLLHCVFGSDNYAYKIVRNSSDQYSIDDIPFNSTGLDSRYVLCLYRLKNGDIVAGTHGSNMYVSKDNAVTWKQVEMNFSMPIITSMAADKKNENFYVATFNGVYVSDNGGNSWTSLGYPDKDINILQLVALPNGGFVVRTDRNVYRYLFNQKSWFTADGNLTAPYRCTGLGIRDNRLCLTINGSAWYVSTNEGNVWSRLTNVSNSMFAMSEVPNTDYAVSIVGSSADIDISFQKDLLKWDTRIDGITKGIYTFSVFSNSIDETFIAARDGIYIFDFLLQRWRNTGNKDVKDKSTYSLCSDPIGNIFAAGDIGVLSFDKKQFDWVQSFYDGTKYNYIASDNRGYIYCSALHGGLYKNSKPTVVLGIPEQVLPADGSKEIVITNTSFQWKSVPNADRFYLQISTTPNFSSIIVKDSSISALNYTVKNLEHTRQYYWRIRAYRGTLPSDWSPVRSFTTQAVYPDKLTLSSPPNASVGQTLENLLRWNKGAEADTFAVQLSMSVDFSVLHAQDSTLTNNVFPIKDLKNSTQYFWRVRGKNRAGYGPWSETWSFTTQSPSGISEDDNSGMSVTVQNSHVILHYGAYSQSVKGIRITDIRGKTILSQTIEQGQSSSDFDMSGMSKGYYVVILDTHTGSISRNVIME